MPLPSTILPLLKCAVCHDTLDSPITLHCGHSVCLRHPLTSCPVRGCTPQRQTRPADSPVRYIPAPYAPPPPIPPVAERRPDVTLANIVSLALQFAEEEEHPRKRHKPAHSPDLLSHLQSLSATHRSIPPDEPLPSRTSTSLAEFESKLADELACHICYTQLSQPVTTHCQHTFCAKCLQRSLDHNPNCPICRTQLPSVFFLEHPLNKIVLSILLHLPKPTTQTQMPSTTQVQEPYLPTPLFVSHLAFPGLPLLLHIFEPRYRLMLRQILSSPPPTTSPSSPSPTSSSPTQPPSTPYPSFGMLPPPSPDCPSPSYGTLLEVRSVQMLPDGRSLISCFGTRRFRVLERGVREGVGVGRVDWIDDYEDELVDEVTTDQDASSVGLGVVPSSSGSGSTRTNTLFRRIADTLTRPSASSSPSSSHTHPNPNLKFPIQRTHPTYPPTPILIRNCLDFLEHLERGAAPWVVQRLGGAYVFAGAGAGGGAEGAEGEGAPTSSAPPNTSSSTPPASSSSAPPSHPPQNTPPQNTPPLTPPTSPALLSFFLASLLPISDAEKAKLLPIRSARMRLVLVNHWCAVLGGTWWFGSGCVVF